MIRSTVSDKRRGGESNTVMCCGFCNICGAVKIPIYSNDMAGGEEEAIKCYNRKTSKV